MKVCLDCGYRFEGEDWRCPKCGHLPEIHDGYPVFAPQLVESYGGFEAHFFHRLAEVEKGNFWFESRNRVLIWALGRYFPQAHNFLEIGCGTGFVLAGIRREFPKLVLYGSDIFVEGLAYAKKRTPQAHFLQMDACSIPFEEEFDVIGAFDVLEHVEKDDVVLLEMFRATKPGGGIILTVPQHRFLWSVVDEYSFHKRRYIRKELVKKVERARFEIIRASSFVFFLLPQMVLYRMKQNRSKGRFDPLAELKIGDLLNAALEKVMGIERLLIKRGFSFPAGGSVLVVAKRDRR